MNTFYPKVRLHPQHLGYIGWSFASTILVSIENAISTHSILSAISCDTEVARTVNYVGKDIIGQMGCLVYMSRLGKRVDSDSKKFLLGLNILQQTSYFATCMTPLFPDNFLIIAGAANIASNISFIGFGAINAKCIQKIAVVDNVGEVYAHISVLMTVGSSIGLVIGVGLAAMIPSHEWRMMLIPAIGLARALTYNRAVAGLI